MRRKDERNSDAAAEPHVDKGACALSQAWLDHSQMPAAARGRMAGDGRRCPTRSADPDPEQPFRLALHQCLLTAVQLPAVSFHVCGCMVSVFGRPTLYTPWLPDNPDRQI